MWIFIILIFVIIALTVPGFFNIIAVLLGIVVLISGAFVLYSYLSDKREYKQKKKREEKEAERRRAIKEQKKQNKELDQQNKRRHLEKNIDEWENIHGKKHFSRMTQEEKVAAKTSNKLFEDSVFQIEVKGVEDNEKDLILMGYKLSSILVNGIRHRIAVVDDIRPCEFAIKKLSLSNYPFLWNKSIKTEQHSEILVVNYQLPALEDIPAFLEIVYKKEQPVVVSPNEKRIKDIWTDISYQITLRSIYELFSSIKLDDIKTIAFNGIIKSLDPSTGHISEKCILSVMADRDIFMELDFSRIEPKQCFKRLKGLAAHDLSSLTPIPPIININKQDKRFIAPDNILDTIDTENNLAVMDWKDFENLIRELFEKEFSSNGSEVKITRASKDGGVDAVVFDSDPIRGGKIIIQAKRYTNIVGVSAVRDLYGTVQHEGAIKGILVTTSDYGSDSYNFAKDKPITLLNGANLLHLMSKHGYKASINIAEARRLLKEIDHE